MKLLKIALLDIIATIVWRIAWSKYFTFIIAQDYATFLWAKSQKRIFEFMVGYCNASGWKGFNGVVNGKYYVIQMREGQQ